MCGISGIVDSTGKSSNVILDRMTDALHHRGPDDRGTYSKIHKNCFIGLGQRRLSIIDLSQHGHQPMIFLHLTLILNGEIYNFSEIREELLNLGYKFESTSDTEVVLKAYHAWGKECVRRFIGMFVFVLFDQETDTLIICRDRAGVKPLFYYYHDGLFLFASELKSFFEHPEFQKLTDDEAVGLFFNFGYVPAPLSIFKDTKKLLPGHFLKYEIGKDNFTLESYWNIFDYFKKPKLDIGYKESMSEMESLLKSSCSYRMVADVPIGVFLSGGYDSTLVAALLQNSGSGKLKTFTIGFPDGVDETPHAQKVADILQTDHTSWQCTYDEAKKIIPDLAYFYDEPNADISCIPTLLVSKIAAQHVKVALSADGGDEVFGGYTGYKQILKINDKINQTSETVLKTGQIFSGVFSNLIPNQFYSVKHKLKTFSGLPISNEKQRLSYLSERIQRMPDSILGVMLNNIKLVDHPGYNVEVDDIFLAQNIPLIFDYITSMSDLLLVKVDRATMAYSLEGREPLLDHRIVEMAAQLPFEYKINGDIQKRILKDIVHQYIPKEIMDRPKAGFDLPVYQWLHKDLSYLLDMYSNQKAIQKSGYFQPQHVEWIIQQFKQGKLRYITLIWRFLIFQMWWEKWME
ncbi:MAG: asparagine synthase (glutamine-hydrolyzing) [Saprospiraceae bacterium]|nr:asparagine synthase (glutamine-hydrolyzing) [Saprospiraceae bacterium]